MNLVSDGHRFDDWQQRFIGEILASIKLRLEGARLPSDQVRKLTEELAFDVASAIDGTSAFEVDGVELGPILSFATEQDELVYCGGNSYMHEYVFRISNEMFGKQE